MTTPRTIPPRTMSVRDRLARYQAVANFLKLLGYHNARKPVKGDIKRRLQETTGFSRAQITRLIAQHRETGYIEDGRNGVRTQ